MDLPALQVQQVDVLGALNNAEAIRSKRIQNALQQLALERQQDEWQALQDYSRNPTPGIVPMTGAAPTNNSAPTAPMTTRVPTTDPDHDTRTVDVGDLPGGPSSFADRFGAATPGITPLPGTTTGGAGPGVVPPGAQALLRHPAQLQQLIAVRQNLNATEKAEFDFKMEKLSTEARGVLPYVNTPEFPQRWNEAVLRLRQQGVIDDQRFRMWYNNPSPLALQQALAVSSSMDAFLKLEGMRTSAEAAKSLANRARGAGFGDPLTSQPPVISRGQPSPQVSGAIKDAATRAGVPQLEGYLTDRAQRESGFDPMAKNQRSSAEGLFQFIDQTWLEQLRKNGAKYGFADEANAIQKQGNNYVITEPQMQQRVMALRRNPTVNALMAAEFTKENATYLKNAGIPVTEGNLHLAHFLGPRGAMEFITAMEEDPSRPATSVVPREVMTNNPDVYIEPDTRRPRTLQEVYRRIANPATGRAPGEPLRVGQAPGSTVSGPAGGGVVAPAGTPGSPGPGGLAPSLQGNAPGFGPGGSSIQALLPDLIELQGNPNLNPALAKTIEQMITWATNEASSTPAMKDYNQYYNYELSMGRKPLGPLEMQLEKERERGRAAALEHGAGQQNKPGLAEAQVAIAKKYADYQQLALDAGKKASLYDDMEEALKGFEPGATADMRYKTAAILKDLGIPIGDGVPDYQVFKALQRRLELVQTPKGQGQISDNERTLIRDTVAETTMTRETILRMIQVMRKLDAFDTKAANVLRENARAYGGAPDPVEGYEALSKLGNPIDKEDYAFLLNARRAGRAEPVVTGRDSAGYTRGVTVQRGRNNEPFLYQGGDAAGEGAWKGVTEDQIESDGKGGWRMKK